MWDHLAIWDHEEAGESGREANMAHLDSHIRGVPVMFQALAIGSFPPQNTMLWGRHFSSPFWRRSHGGSERLIHISSCK